MDAVRMVIFRPKKHIITPHTANAVSAFGSLIISAKVTFLGIWPPMRFIKKLERLLI
jgi:hypothetical protein